MSKANYDVLETLGTGSFGTVCKLRRKADGKMMVWKDINFGKMSEKEKSQLVAEVNILRDLRNPFIVRYHDRIVDKPSTRLFIIMEYCAGGDLGKVIKKCKRDKVMLEEAYIWKVFAQATVALKECHRRVENGETKPIIHRDLKPANILLDANQNIKIGDFGLAKELSSRSKLCQTNVGTPFYMAPEIINEKDYDERSDIWSLGCLLYELAAQRPPFDATNAVSLAMKINAGKYTRIPSKYSDALFDCIRNMLQLDPRRRPRVEDLETVPAMQSALASARAIVSEFQNQQSLQTKTSELSRREEAVQRREEAVAQTEATLMEKEKSLARWAEQLQAQQNELTALLQANGRSTTVPNTQPPQNQAVAYNTRRQSLEKRMSIEPMVMDDDEHTIYAAEATTSVEPAPIMPVTSAGAKDLLPPPPPAPSSTTMGGFAIYQDRSSAIPTSFADVPQAVRRAKELLSGKSVESAHDPKMGLRQAPSAPTYNRVNVQQAPVGINKFQQNCAGAAVGGIVLKPSRLGRPEGFNMITEEEKENRKGTAWERQSEADQKYGAMVTDGTISPWKRPRQFAGPVPVPTKAPPAPPIFGR